MDPESVKVGYIRRAHGIKGAVVVRPLTDDPNRFIDGSTFATDRADPSHLTVTAVQPHKDGLLVAFAGIASRDVAEGLRGVSLSIQPEQRRQLGPDEYWPEQLVGLRVIDVDGIQLGSVSAVVEGSAQDRLQVVSPDGQFEIPFVGALVIEVDVAGGRVVVDLPVGLLDL